MDLVFGQSYTMNFINKNDELTLTHVNETKGADLSIAALHKERNKYKIPKQFMSTLNSGKSKELDRPLARSKSERYNIWKYTPCD